MRILAVDPGETTGLALRVGEDVWVAMAREREEVWRVIAGLGKGDEVVVEDFVTAGRISKHGLFTVRLVGALEALCWARGIRMHKQVPMYRISSLSTAEKMRPPLSRYEHRHEKDALAHLLAFERDKRGEKHGRPRGGEGGPGERQAVRSSVSQLLKHRPGLGGDSGGAS